MDKRKILIPDIRKTLDRIEENAFHEETSIERLASVYVQMQEAQEHYAELRKKVSEKLEQACKKEGTIEALKEDKVVSLRKGVSETITEFDNEKLMRALKLPLYARVTDVNMDKLKDYLGEKKMNEVLEHAKTGVSSSTSDYLAIEPKE